LRNVCRMIYRHNKNVNMRVILSIIEVVCIIGLTVSHRQELIISFGFIGTFGIITEALFFYSLKNQVTDEEQNH
jgi:hypothetical protein